MLPMARSPALCGEPIATLCCTADRGRWLLPSTSWWPLPPRVPAQQANVEWVRTRCDHRTGHRIVLRATRDISANDTLTCSDNRFILGEQEERFRWAVSFDGGARAVGDPPVRVAGAGAILWTHDQSFLPTASDDEWYILAEATAELPSERWAPAAEAWGFRIALDLINQLERAGEAVRITGDNLSVIRFGAGHGRLRRPDMEALLSNALATTLQLGWTPSWNAAPRRYNSEADALATEALQRARLRFDISTTPSIHIRWRHNIHPRPLAPPRNNDPPAAFLGWLCVAPLG